MKWKDEKFTDVHFLVSSIPIKTTEQDCLRYPVYQRADPYSGPPSRQSPGASGAGGVLYSQFCRGYGCVVFIVIFIPVLHQITNFDENSMASHKVRGPACERLLHPGRVGRASAPRQEHPEATALVILCSESTKQAQNRVIT